MKLSVAAALLSAGMMAGTSHSFSTVKCYSTTSTTSSIFGSSTASLFAIRPKTGKSEELRFGWDGTTALGKFCS
jgi:hypothetical protein